MVNQLGIAAMKVYVILLSNIAFKESDSNSEMDFENHAKTLLVIQAKKRNLL